MVGMAPFFKRSFVANFAWYWPKFVNDSGVKCLAQTPNNKPVESVAGTASLKMNFIHWSLIVWSVFGIENTFACCFGQSTTEQLTCALGFSIFRDWTEYEGERGRAGFLLRCPYMVYPTTSWRQEGAEIKISYLSGHARALVYLPLGKQTLHF